MKNMHLRGLITGLRIFVEFFFKKQSYTLDVLLVRYQRYPGAEGSKARIKKKPQSIIRTFYVWKTHMNWGGYRSWYQHTENLCEVKKKGSLRGAFNSHNPQLTQTSAQSEAAPKVRGDTSTYINHEWSHHKKNSNAHKHHSASVCKQFFFFLLSVFPHKGIHQRLSGLLSFLFFHDSSVLSWCLLQASKVGSTGLCAQLFQ